MKKSSIFLLILIFVLLLSYLVSIKNDYREFSLDKDMCENYFNDCNCFGELIIMESYPQQYICNGFDYCNDINITECTK
ncbi:hypothetical protein HOK68_01165 [Candidatus Woesearchaeota archaeon]|jgi:hypothetical protein|nr:hypothetical protein [Candidatus Woesearchaeota archaeon]MBT4387663.1 hypothetical protein [Candidatus Woesearchaeota archaeon]MBT4595974.1 hypothetical protein [Candidatus Woesearchaeota archaeon]MBT5741104.1 hypothetical protein [Candidatus Woesearchaeota archaeon]MBT6505371.1 hypothetical protein [Candidatus Woesearchaeota archaeon]